MTPEWSISKVLFCTISAGDADAKAGLTLDVGVQAAPWCYGDDAWLLGGDFLIVWGARWGPLMRAQPYRWFTSWFLHQSFTHVLSNMLLFLVIAIQVPFKPLHVPATFLCGTMVLPA